ncbi:NAD-dependent epimerase/dehydratase family protein [Bacteroides ihuae]|uniref:NAD-dependent epimerase/dehydratase family protein n=1 Tax=Bacteroides ihuae TaxID=1852362 RepID=UPI0008D949C3|nr:NAD-dependent epimerase/dehydratase family protein [Bacteroides ihuae]
MKVLVTGAAGFIGFHVVKKLATQGMEVVGIDNLNTYYDIDLKYARLSECGVDAKKIVDNEYAQSDEYANYTFLKIDLVDMDRLTKLFDDEQFDVVINLGAQAGVRYSIENPSTYIQSNIVGFLNILESCRYHHIKHLVYASSSSVYGMNDKLPFSEDDVADSPVSLYAATKRSDELMAYTYSHLYHLPTTGLRFFTVYGPWGRPDMSPMLFADSILTGKTINVFNNGEMVRDFTYIDDIVDGILEVIPCIPGKEGEELYCRILNIGNSEPVPLMLFIHTMEETLGRKASLHMLPMQAGDVKATYADVTKLIALTGYSPHTPLKKGLSSFVAWYEAYIHAKDTRI